MSDLPAPVDYSEATGEVRVEVVVSRIIEV